MVGLNFEEDLKDLDCLANRVLEETVLSDRHEDEYMQDSGVRIRLIATIAIASKLKREYERSKKKDD